ncbi:MAG: hypothetical protein ACFFC7_14875 [Candidatus Hermodarchaeota archaeon]
MPARIAHHRPRKQGFTTSTSKKGQMALNFVSEPNSKPKSKLDKEITFELGKQTKADEVVRAYTTGVQYLTAEHPLNEGNNVEQFRELMVRAVGAYLLENSPDLPETKLELVLHSTFKILKGVKTQKTNEHFHQFFERLKTDQSLATEEYLVIARTLLKTVQKRPVVAKVQQLCTEATEKCLNYADQATTLIEQGVIRGTGKYAAATLAKELGDRSNLGQSAFLTLVETGKKYLEDLKKLDDVRSFFKQHQDAWATFLLFGISTWAKRYLARKWRVKELGVYNFLTQVRRKLDASEILPLEYWIFPDQHTNLKKTALYPPLNAKSFQKACQSKIDQVEEDLQRFSPQSSKFKRTQTFLNKLHKLGDSTTIASLLQFLFDESPTGPMRMGRDALNAKVTHIQSIIGGRTKKYYSALEAVLSLAAVLNPKEFAVPVHSLKVDTLLTPENCLNRPFSRKIKERQAYEAGGTRQDPLVYHRQPISLVMKHNQVIIRPGNAKELTHRMCQEGYIDLWVPDCQIKRLKGVLFRQRPLERPRQSGNVRKRVLIRVPATAKMLQVLRQGAQVQLLQLMPPRGPARKITVNIVFKGHPLAFVACKYLGPTSLQAYQDDIVFIPPSGVRLAADLNRVGRDVVAFSTKSQLSSSMRKMCRTYHQTTQELRRLHRQLSYARQSSDIGRIRTLQREISHVERRRCNLRQEIHAQCSVEIGLQLVLTGVSVLLTESLTLNPTGTRGELAKAIYNMPDELKIIERAALAVSTCFPDQPITLRVLRPDGTSLIHVSCPHSPPERLKRSVKHYDWAPCSECQRLVNTHTNSAQQLIERDQLSDLSPPSS